MGNKAERVLEDESNSTIDRLVAMLERKQQEIDAERRREDRAYIEAYEYRKVLERAVTTLKNVNHPDPAHVQLERNLQYALDNPRRDL